MSEIVTCRICGTKHEATGSCPRCNYTWRHCQKMHRALPPRKLNDETLAVILRPKKPEPRAAERYDFQDYAAAREQAKKDHRRVPSYGEWQAKNDGLL